MTRHRLSLAHRLTVRLVLLQVVTLMAFALSMPLLDIVKGKTRVDAPDPKAGHVIAAALRLRGGGLVLQPEASFHTLVASAPELWFIATDQTGQRLTFGEVPPSMAAIAPSALLFEEVRFTQADALVGEALLTREQIVGGDIWLLFGNGPTVGPWRALARAAAENVGPLAIILVALAAATAWLTPQAIDTALAGMRRAARRARLIDIDRRGTRLPTADVPSEIAPLVDAVNEALGRIDEGYERQQRFLANAAHELRTPIAILQNRIELLSGTNGSAGLRLERLLLDVQRIANLAEQLLDLQRIDLGKLEPESVDLVAVARRVVADLAPLMLEAGYTPQLCTSQSSMVISGDGNAIERAVINLVQNAIAHGGDAGTILVEVEKDAIIVSDDGPGISVQQREQIFEPFHRLRPKASGAGLGLALVREIMARHQGSVVVGDSRTGGARFALRFAPDPVPPAGGIIKAA